MALTDSPASSRTLAHGAGGFAGSRTSSKVTFAVTGKCRYRCHRPVGARGGCAGGIFRLASDLPVLLRDESKGA